MRPQVTRLVFGGLTGTLAMTAMMYEVAPTVLWLMAQTIVMPMMGGGLFSAAAGGMVAAVASLVGHLVYGSILGAVSAGADLQLAHA